MRYTWKEVADGAIDAAPEPVRSSVAAARNFACGLYRNYEQFFGNTVPQGPLEGLKRGVWDRICTDLPPVRESPIPPVGQETCSCVVYQARVIILNDVGVKIQDTYSQEFTGPFFGTRRNSSGGGQYGLEIIQGVCQNGQVVGTSFIGTAVVPSTYNAYVAEVRPKFPNAGCPALPPSPAPEPPPPERQRENVNININANTTINAPITLVRPTVNVDIRPEIEIAVGPLNINFDLGGIRVDVNPTFSPTIYAPTVNLPSFPPGEPPRPPALPPDGGDCPDPCEEFDYDRIEDAIRFERRFYARNQTQLRRFTVETAAGGSVPVPVTTRFIRVRLVRDPNNVKEQFGNGGTDVLYAGWCAWGLDAPGERIPLSYRDNCFPVPEGCNFFSWTVYNGGIAEITLIAEVELEACETSQCVVNSVLP